MTLRMLDNKWRFALLNLRLLFHWLMGRPSPLRYQQCETVAEELAVHRRWLGDVYLSLRRLAARPENDDLPRLPELRDAYSEALVLTDALIGVNEQLRGLQFALRQAVGDRAETLGYQVIAGMVIFRRLWRERQNHLKIADEIVRHWMKEIPYARLSALDFHVQAPLPRRR